MDEDRSRDNMEAVEDVTASASLRATSDPKKTTDEVDTNEKNTVSVSSTTENLKEILHFSWSVYMQDHPETGLYAAPVSNFEHVALYTEWDKMVTTGLFVEYEVGNIGESLAYWIGVVEELQGYLVRVRPMGVSKTRKKWKIPCVWLNLLTDCKRLGTKSTKKGAFLSPPIVEEAVDWKAVLMREVRGGYSISNHLENLVEVGTKALVREGVQFEVLDNENVSQYKLATLKKTVGHRFYFKYWDDQEPTAPKGGFWCHTNSGLFRPKGWCKTIGVKIDAQLEYNPKGVRSDCFIEKAANDSEVEVGMKLECVDPVQPFQLCSATVLQVLRDGFMLIGFDHADEDFDAEEPNNDSMYVHVTWTTIFECGFAKEQDISLVPPRGYAPEEFSWEKYFSLTNQKPVKLPKREKIAHEFEVGHRLEAVDQIDSSLVCAATVSDVKGRLLRIHFDGWPEDDYDQWMDVKSVNLYPIGWCQSMGYPLTGPKGGLLDESFCGSRARSPKLALDAVKLPKSNPKRGQLSVSCLNSKSRLAGSRRSTTTANRVAHVQLEEEAESVRRYRTLKRKSAETESEVDKIKKSQIMKRKSADIQEYFPSDMGHEEVKAEAIKLGKQSQPTDRSREKIRAIADKLKSQPSASMNLTKKSE